MAEILSDEFAKEKIAVPFLEFPTQSHPSSEQRKKFWEELKKTVEPHSFTDDDPESAKRNRRT